MTRTKLEEKLAKKYNNKYIYYLDDNIEIKNSTVIKYKCPIHGNITQPIMVHMYRDGVGCEKCGIDKRSLTKVIKSAKLFITKANKVHHEKYDYSLVSYEKSYEKVIIICEEHGEFKMTPNCHLGSRGSGCPICAQNIRIKAFTDKAHTQEEIIIMCNKVHRNKYDYSKLEYTTVSNKHIIICKEHGEFNQALKCHIYQSHGCPKCRSSKGEIVIRNYLLDHNIKFEEQYKDHKCKDVNILSFDFYLSDYNTIIEFDGLQHYKPIKHFGGLESFKKNQRRDDIKNKYCEKNNIKMERIRYDQNIEDTLSSILKNYN